MRKRKFLAVVLTVFATALMLGCALLFSACNSNSHVDTGSNTEQTGDGDGQQGGNHEGPDDGKGDTSVPDPDDTPETPPDEGEGEQEVVVMSVALNKTSLALEIGESETLSVTVLPNNATDKNVTWTSSEPSVATVANGSVTAVGGGMTTITATTSNGKKATCSVTVNEPAPEIIEVTSISLSQTSLTLEIGESQTLTATVLPSNATNKSVTWTSSVQSVATVANGKVTAVGSGTATITATTSNGKKATCSVTVDAAVPAITQVEGATIDGTEIFMLVDHTTDSVPLLNKVTVSSGRWDLYSDILGQNRIPTKIAAGSNGKLQNGENVFYIMLENENGDLAEVYTLTVYRSYAVSVNYYNHKNVLVHSETAYTGYEYALNFDYSTPGYTFNSWKENGVAYQSRVLWNKLSLYADMMANEYTIALDANGGMVGTAEQKVTYDTSYSLPLPEREGHTFLGWYVEETQLTDERGQSLVAWQLPENSTLTAAWKINQYDVAIEYESSAGTVTGTAAGTYDYDTEITLTASAPDLGYAFLGWYLNGEFVTTENTYNFSLPANNVSLVAQYKVLSEMSVFTFTSTLTSCTITGIKDKTVTSIAVPDYVTNIEEGAFSGCASLESITLQFVGGSATATSASSSTLFGYIFGTSSYTGGTATQQNYGNSNATYYIPASLHSVTIMGGNILYGAFYNCSGLTDVIIGNGVISIDSYAFHNCYKLIEVNNQSALSLTIGSSFNGEVTYYAKNVYTQVEGESWITDTEEGYRFFYDENEKVGYLIGYYGKDTSLTLPDSFIAYDGTSVDEYEIYQYAFEGCGGMINLVIPNSVTSIGNSAFTGCRNLTSITLPFVGSSVAATSASGSTLFGYIFGTDEYAGGSLITQRYSWSSSYSMKYCIPSSLRKVTITGGYILYGAFYNCDVTSVTLGNSVTSIGERAFYNCSSMISVTIGSGVTSVGDDAFSSCTALTSIEIPDSVESIGNGAFSGCLGLTSITIPNSVTSIGASAFRGCSRLTCVTLGDSVTRIERSTFTDCRALMSVTIPDSVTSIDDFAFQNCSRLTSVIIGNGVTSIGSYAFLDCNALTSVTFKNPNGWWYSSSETATSGTSIASSSLSNLFTAATYLKSTYSYYFWKRS